MSVLVQPCCCHVLLLAAARFHAHHRCGEHGGSVVKLSIVIGDPANTRQCQAAAGKCLKMVKINVGTAIYGSRS